MAELIFSKEFFAYFYFGIYSKPDYEYVSSLVEYFNEKWKLLSIKSFPNHQTLSIFKNIIDYLNIVKYKFPGYFETIKELEDDEYIEKLIKLEDLEYCEKVMVANNIYLQNDIIDLIKYKIPESKISIVDRIKSIPIIDAYQVKADSKILVFLITKSYYGTDIFKNDYQEALKLKKNVLVLILEKNIDFLESNKFQKIINICELFEACRFDLSIDVRRVDLRNKFINFISEVDETYSDNKARHVYFSFLKASDEPKFNDLISMLNKEEFNKIEKIDQPNLLDSLENFNCFVFFISKNHSRSYLFELANKLNKSTILIKLDNAGVDYDHYKSVKFNLPINCESNKEAMKHFQSLLNMSLKLNRPQFTNFSSSCDHIYSSENQFDFNQIEIKMINDNEAIISDFAGCSYIVNLLTNRIIRIQSSIQELCWIDHLDKMLVRNSLSVLLCDRFQNRFKIIRKNFCQSRFQKVLAVYMKTNRKTYIYSDQLFLIFNENFKLECHKRFKIKQFFNVQVVHDKILLIDEESIYIVDSNIELLKHLKFESKIQINIQFDSNHVFVSTINNIQIISLKSLNVIGFIETKKNLLMVFKDYLLLETRNFFQIYKLDFKKNRNSSIFLCNFNPFENPHLYCDPYIIPCGQTVCLNCIYENSDDEKHLSCYFCNQKHSILPQSLKKNHEIETLLLNEEIMKEIFEKGEPILDDLESYWSRFNDRFDYIENMLEVRFQSIYNELNKEELKLVNRIKMSIERRSVPRYFQIEEFDFKLILNFATGILNNFSITNQYINSRFKIYRNDSSNTNIHRTTRVSELNFRNMSDCIFNVNPILTFLKRNYFCLPQNIV